MTSRPAIGMKTNGAGQFVDWLNHTRSLEAAAEARRAAPRPCAGKERRRQ